MATRQVVMFIVTKDTLAKALVALAKVARALGIGKCALGRKGF